MAAKKRGSGKKKSSGSAATTATASPQETDELFVPKGNIAAATKTAKTKTKTTHNAAFGSDDDSDNDGAGVVELKVNEKFAKAFQEQKRKEELTRLERQRKLYGAANDDDDDDSESESETEDEDGEQLTRALDADIRKTLQLIRKKDPAIYDQSIAFFQKNDDDDASSSDSDGSNDDASDAKRKRKQKRKQKKDAPLYYKDLVRQQVIAGDVDSEDDADKRDADASRVMTYGEEQAKLKQDFLQSLRGAADSDSDDDNADGDGKQPKTSSDNDDGNDDDALDGGLFTIRKKTADEAQAEAAEYAAFTTKYGSALAQREVDPDAFLEHYLSSEGWKDKRAAVPHYDDIVNRDDDDDSADELERAEAFEHSYNFRFEEDGSGVIATHARHIDDTLRREDDSRKRKRAERKERKALERLKKEEELRRLKNLKQAEVESKLAKVAKLMGKDTPEAAALKLTAHDLDGEFDPDEYDRRMQEVFDEEYYNDADADTTTMAKPVWDDDEDRELFAGLPVDSDDDADDEAATAVNIVEPDDADDGGEDTDEDADGDDEDDPLSAAKVAGMSAAELARAKQQYLDELYALDYEDLIGDLKCRFKYRSVPTNDFGLTVDEIMAADDKELKALVSLKRLAPYHDSEFQVDRKRIKQFKKTLAEVQRERQAKRQKKQQQADDAAEADGADAVVDAVAVGGKKRKRAKKSKAAATVAATESEDTAAAAVATETPTKSSKKHKSKGEVTVSTGADTTAEKEPATAAADVSASVSGDTKKKQRRSKKKSDGGAASALKATGLSTSRLESYKLTKASASKKKHK